EDVVEGAIIALGPDMRGVGRVDQLSRDPYSWPELSDAALEHVTHAQFAADILHADCSSLIDKGRVASDDEQPLNPRQSSDDVLDHAVGEIVLFGIPTHVLEWQDRDRRLESLGKTVCRLNRRGRIPGGNNPCRRSGLDMFDNSDKSVSDARHRRNEAPSV